MTPSPTRPPVGTELRRIAVRDLTTHPGNPRQHMAEIEELAASIQQVGLIEPLVVERLPAGYRILAGHRRLAAARLIRLKDVPCVVRPPVHPADALVLMLIENGQRANLDPIEEARGYARLRGLDPKLTQDEIARRIGKSQAHVSQRLLLLNLSHDEQEQIRRGDLLLRDAREEARKRAGTSEQTRYTGWHLGKTHPLGGQVRDMCRAAGHTGARRLGGMGCGACWERAIRQDERARILSEQQLVDFPADGLTQQGPAPISEAI